MKSPQLALGAVLLGILLAGPVWGQALLQPASVRQVAFENDYGYYLAEDAAKAPAAKSPSDVPPPVAEAAPPAPSGRSACDPGCCDPGCCDPGCDPCGQACGRGCVWGPGIKFGGWLQAGMTGNFEDPHDRYNGPMMTNDRVGQLQMNQAWLYAERGVNTRGYGFDIGGRVDAFYGTDWRVADCYGNGLEDRLNGPNSLYGMSIPQFYAEFAINSLSIKIGRMTGVLGYESVVPMPNFFYSHNYQLCYVEPVLITGLMAQYTLTDNFRVMGGIHNGLHQFENQNGDMNFQGGVVWTNDSGTSSLGYALDLGRNDIHALHDQYIHSIVFKQQLSRRLQYVLQSDYSVVNDAGLNGEDIDAYGIAQYLIYKMNSKWSAGARIEWFRDDDGTVVMGSGNLPDARGWMGAPGYAGSFTELTMGLNWKPRPNILVRPEVRWDWYDGPANPNGTYPHPFDDGNSDRQFTFATDVVLTF